MDHIIFCKVKPDGSYEYDSVFDTLDHIHKVANYLSAAATELLRRAQVHDSSKLASPEKELFDTWTPILAGLTYGSKEYTDSMQKLKVALDHHYANNSHHPEHYADGIDGMTLFDIIEMFFDWKAAGERHKNGNFYQSLLHNRTRFQMSEQLFNIFLNTAEMLGFPDRENYIRRQGEFPLQ